MSAFFHACDSEESGCECFCHLPTWEERMAALTEAYYKANPERVHSSLGGWTLTTSVDCE